MKTIIKITIITTVALMTSSSAFAYHGTSHFYTDYDHVFQEAFEAY